MTKKEYITEEIEKTEGAIKALEDELSRLVKYAHRELDDISAEGGASSAKNVTTYMIRVTELCKQIEVMKWTLYLLKTAVEGMNA